MTLTFDVNVIYQQELGKLLLKRNVTEPGLHALISRFAGALKPSGELICDPEDLIKLVTKDNERILDGYYLYRDVAHNNDLIDLTLHARKFWTELMTTMSKLQHFEVFNQELQNVYQFDRHSMMLSSFSGEDVFSNPRSVAFDDHDACCCSTTDD